MKWTLIPLVAAALAVYALIFIAQSGHQSPTPSAAPDLAPAARPAPLAQSAPDAVAPATQTEVEAASQKLDASGDTAEAGPTNIAHAWATGCRLYEAGSYAEARPALEQAVREAEDHARRHYLLGLCYTKLDEADLAVDELERTVELAPSFVRAKANLARAYLKLDEPESARELVDAALENHLDFADAWEVLGRIELSQGHREEAEAAFSKAVRLDPEHAWAWNNLGYLRILEGRFEEALQPLQQAAALRPELASFENNLGIALERTGDLKGAVACYEKADELGHDRAAASAQRVQAVLAARTVQPVESEGSPRLAAAGGDSGSAEAW